MATAVSTWTVADLAVYCEHCMVIAITEDDKYCDGCADEVAEYLAARFTEQGVVENGWY